MSEEQITGGAVIGGMVIDTVGGECNCKPWIEASDDKPLDTKSMHTKLLPVGSADNPILDLAEVFVGDFETVIGEVFSDGYTQAIALLEAADLSDGEGEGLIDLLEQLLDILEKDSPENVRPFMQDIFEIGGKIGMERVEVSNPFDTFNPLVTRSIDAQMQRLQRTVSRAVTEDVGRQLKAGLEVGDSIAELSHRLEEFGAGEIGPIRSRVIARTESAEAFSKGQILAWKQSGVVAGKRWLLAPEPCEFCQAVADADEKRQAALKLNQTFVPMGRIVRGVDGGKLKINYRTISEPPLHPNCRCDTIPVFKGEQ